jgi:hypothetical protein
MNADETERNPLATIWDYNHKSEAITNKQDREMEKKKKYKSKALYT